MLAGLLVGALTSGVALALVLTLYLQKTSKTNTCSEKRETHAEELHYRIGTCSVISLIIETLITTTTASMSTATTTQGNSFDPQNEHRPFSFLGYNINLVANGDAEAGFCSVNQTISSPAGWSYSGPISELWYNNSFFRDQTYSTPGPR